MEPTIHSEERVLSSPLLLFFGLREGDIVVFPHPQTGETLVKRVIWIKGNEVWVEGDNKNNSEDSRIFGSIKRTTIQEKVWHY